MSWFRVDDSFPDHPKLEAIEGDPVRHAIAVAAWTLLGADSSGRGTDGFITSARVAKVLATWPSGMRAKACSALVEAKMWEERPDGAYQFHDWADYQPTKEQREIERRATRERQRAWKEKRRGGNGVANAPGNAVTDGVDDSASDVVQNAAPSRPVPSRPVRRKEKSRSADAESADALRESISELEARYPIALIADVRAGCSRSRASGKVADSVWHGVLVKLSGYALDVAVRGMATYVDRYAADGSKDEAYMLGIVRGEAKLGPMSAPPPRAPESPRRVLSPEEAARITAARIAANNARLPPVIA